MLRRLLPGLSLIAASAALCQTPPSPPPQPVPSAPTPSVSTPAQTPSMPAYDPDKAKQQPAIPQAPPPAQGQAPVVVPATPTPQAPVAAMPPYIPYGIPDEDRIPEHYGSTYIPMDSWVYPALTRLYGMGFVDTMTLSMRPYTRQGVLHMLNDSEDDIRSSDNEEAQEIFAKLIHELTLEDTQGGILKRGPVYGVESVYTRLMGISGPTLRDSYHLGQTLYNDYGRPYEPGFNSLAGFSSIDEYGRFSLYVRGEYQHSPGGTGYSPALAGYLSNVIDGIPYSGYNLVQATIPSPVIGSANPFRLVEANLSFHIAGHEISGGKSDAWLGPAQGGALAWSNNAENIYSFQINRVEPLRIPLLSRLLGPVRYNFFYGSLKGHTDPEDDWVHSEMFAFRPTKNFEFGFQRTVIFGGKGHEPVTLHTFLKGFFDVSDTSTALKFSRDDPGARFAAFNMSYRLPFVRKYVLFYADSIAHDDVTPPSAPRRADFRTGLYLSQIPGMRKIDFRVEAVDTDPITSRSTQGSFAYYENVQRQAYTNKGFILGDWIGREAKGGQAWLTYHLSGDEFVQLEYLNKKNDKDFGPGPPDPTQFNGFDPLGGTTQNQVKAQVVKRLMHDNLELNAWVQYERWTVPAYKTGQQSDTVAAFQFTYYPGLKSPKSR